MMNFIPIDFQIESLSCQAPLDHCFFNKHFKLVLREPRRGSGDVAQRLVNLKKTKVMRISHTTNKNIKITNNN